MVTKRHEALLTRKEILKAHCAMSLVLEFAAEDKALADTGARKVVKWMMENGLADHVLGCEARHGTGECDCGLQDLLVALGLGEVQNDHVD